jgi:putative serine protease PepD
MGEMTDPSNEPPPETGLGRPRGPRFRRPGSPLLPGEYGRPAGPPLPSSGTAARVRRWIATAVVVAAVAVIAIGGYRFWTSTQAASFEPERQAVSGAPAGSLRDVAAAVLPSVVEVQVRGATRRAGSGSGFVVDSNGHVLTNAHVIQGASTVQVTFSTGETTDAQLVGASPEDDIAVLQVPLPAGVRPLQLGRSQDVRVGDDVLAVGSPLGLSGTVTAGIVSAVDRQVTIGDRTVTALQTDASINPGNSGGPLVGLSGQVVGVTTTIATLPGSDRSIGIGFAIPVDRAADVARRIIQGE